MNNFTLIIFLYVGKYLTHINTHSVIRRNEYHTLPPTAYIYFQPPVSGHKRTALLGHKGEKNKQIKNTLL